MGRVFSQRTLKAGCRSCAFRGRLSFAWRKGRMRISWLRTPVTPWDGCETEKPWGGLCSHGVLVRGWSRISPGICEAGSAVTPGRGAEQMANRLHGSSAQKAASATECKECQRCVAGVSHRQDSLEDGPDQDSAFAPGGCQGQAVRRDQGWFNVGATDRALLSRREDAQGTERCSSLVYGHQSGLL